MMLTGSRVVAIEIILIIDDTQSNFDIESLVVADSGHHRAHKFQENNEGLMWLNLLSSRFRLLNEPLHNL